MHVKTSAMKGKRATKRPAFATKTLKKIYVKKLVQMDKSVTKTLVSANPMHPAIKPVKRLALTGKSATKKPVSANPMHPAKRYVKRLALTGKSATKKPVSANPMHPAKRYVKRLALTGRSATKTTVNASPMNVPYHVPMEPSVIWDTALNALMKLNTRAATIR